MRSIKAYIKQLLRKLSHVIHLNWYKLAGPPRILSFDSVLNVAILRQFGAQIGAKNVRVLSPLVLSNAKGGYANLSIADYCYLSGNVFLDLTCPIILEEGVSLGPGVTIMTHNSYNMNSFLIDRLWHTCGRKEVVIKRGAGIKAHALITLGVTIGEDSVVAGGSVVNTDVPRRHLVAGVPARIVTEII